MGEILSQSEIDELLSALASGQDKPKVLEAANDTSEVRPYNFRTANKFPKEQIRLLHFIYDNYAGRLSTFLSGMLRVMCDVEVVSIEEQSFAEFNNSLPTPVFLGILNIQPMVGSSLMEISSAVAYEMISRLFGGTGQFSDSSKLFTEIEITILGRIIGQMLTLMGESWERVVGINATLDRIETSSQFAQIVASNEPIAIITMNLKIGEVSDVINLCIPHVAIQPISKNLATTLWYNDGAAVGEGEINAQNITPQFSNTDIAVRAVFDPTEATVSDILNLQIGDVIRVNHNIDQKITLMVGHTPKFKGTLGVHNQKLAVRISEILRGEDAENE